jgi:hypothetical protein
MGWLYMKSLNGHSGPRTVFDRSCCEPLRVTNLSKMARGKAEKLQHDGSRVSARRHWLA